MAKVLTDNGYIQELEDKERKKKQREVQKAARKEKEEKQQNGEKQRKRNGILPAGRRPFKEQVMQTLQNHNR